MPPRPLSTTPRRSRRISTLLTRATVVAAALLLSMLSASAGELQDGWVSFDDTSTPTPPSVTVMFSSSTEIALRVTTPGILCETVVEDTLEFHRISAPGCYHSPDVGYACVPLIGQLIAVPEGAELEVSVAVPDTADTVYFSDAAVYPTPALVVEYRAAVSSSDAAEVLTLDVFPVTTEWDGDTVEWVDGWTTAGGDFDKQVHAVWTAVSGESSVVRFDVTEMVAAWVSGTQPNLGLIVRAAPGEVGTAEPADMAGDRGGPTLTVWYTGPERRGRRY